MISFGKSFFGGMVNFTDSIMKSLRRLLVIYWIIDNNENDYQ